VSGLARLFGGATGVVLEGAGRSFWLPAQRSTQATEVDQLFYFIFWISVFFFFVILAMATFFLAKYRRRGAEPVRRDSAHHNTGLEMIWSGIPLAIVLAIFVMGFRSYMDLATPPENSYQISVNGQKWNWSFTYPNGYVDSELHVPAGHPVELVMTATDVIHSFYVPELRVKQDVVPGRYTKVWFEATEPFESRVLCTEYCGTNHSSMQARFVAHAPEEFDAWLSKAADFVSQLPPDQAGRLLYEKRGCAQCHSIDGSGGIGPTLLGSFGARRQFTDGSSGAVDENYIRESLLNPRAKTVAGFDPVMPTFMGRLKENEVEAIIAYIKSLGGGGG
jgi:cytochrome c oxidase subunit 2